MSTILDRYLYAVAQALPDDVQREDIVAELRDDLESQLEGRTSDAGRALTDDEMAALLRDYGHPLAVAARYRRVQYLIGPAFFPFYWGTLRTTLTITLALEILAGGIGAIMLGNGLLFFDALDVAWKSALWIAGIVTVVFALAERVPDADRTLAARSRRWDPLRLPSPARVAPGTHRIPLDRFVAALLTASHLTPSAAWNPLLIAATIATGALAVSALAGPLFVPPHAGAQNAAVWALVIAIGLMLAQIALSLRALAVSAGVPRLSP